MEKTRQDVYAEGLARLISCPTVSSEDGKENNKGNEAQNEQGQGVVKHQHRAENGQRIRRDLRLPHGSAGEGSGCLL